MPGGRRGALGGEGGLLLVEGAEEVVHHQGEVVGEVVHLLVEVVGEGAPLLVEGVVEVVLLQGEVVGVEDNNQVEVEAGEVRLQEVEEEEEELVHFLPVVVEEVAVEV